MTAMGRDGGIGRDQERGRSQEPGNRSRAGPGGGAAIQMAEGDSNDPCAAQVTEDALIIQGDVHKLAIGSGKDRRDGLKNQVRAPSTAGVGACQSV